MGTKLENEFSKLMEINIFLIFANLTFIKQGNDIKRYAFLTEKSTWIIHPWMSALRNGWHWRKLNSFYPNIKSLCQITVLSYNFKNQLKLNVIYDTVRPLYEVLCCERHFCQICLNDVRIIHTADRWSKYI